MSGINLVVPETGDQVNFAEHVFGNHEILRDGLNTARDDVNGLNAMVSEQNGLINAMRVNQVDLAINLETVSGALLTGVDKNIVVETFQDANDVEILGGGCDAVKKNIRI